MYEPRSVGRIKNCSISDLLGAKSITLLETTCSGTWMVSTTLTKTPIVNNYGGKNDFINQIGGNQGNDRTPIQRHLIKSSHLTYVCIRPHINLWGCLHGMFTCYLFNIHIFFSFLCIHRAIESFSLLCFEEIFNI